MRTDFKQKRKPVYLDKNGKVCYSKSFISSEIYKLMISKSKQFKPPTFKTKSNDLASRDKNLFRPADLYKDLSEYFLAFFNKKPDKNTFYLCAADLIKQNKIIRVGEKGDNKNIYYKLIEHSSITK